MLYVHAVLFFSVTTNDVISCSTTARVWIISKVGTHWTPHQNSSWLGVLLHWFCYCTGAKVSKTLNIASIGTETITWHPYSFNLILSTGTEGGDDVIQEPKIIWEPKNGSASLSCKHNKDISYRQMYWYRQRPGETMRLIVFTVAGSEPDFGDVDKNKFEPQKSDAKSGSLKVKDLETDDSAIYFCAVSEHSVTKTGESCTKTFCA